MLKKLPVSVGDAGSIPGSGRSPGRGNGNPLQYSCLENPIQSHVAFSYNLFSTELTMACPKGGLFWPHNSRSQLGIVTAVDSRDKATIFIV